MRRSMRSMQCWTGQSRAQLIAVKILYTAATDIEEVVMAGTKKPTASMDENHQAIARRMMHRFHSRIYTSCFHSLFLFQMPIQPMEEGMRPSWITNSSCYFHNMMSRLFGGPRMCAH